METDLNLELSAAALALALLLPTVSVIWKEVRDWETAVFFISVAASGLLFVGQALRQPSLHASYLRQNISFFFWFAMAVYIVTPLYKLNHKHKWLRRPIALLVCAAARLFEENPVSSDELLSRSPWWLQALSAFAAIWLFWMLVTMVFYAPKEIPFLEDFWPV